MSYPVLISNDALSCFARKMKFQVVAEELVTVHTHTMEGETVLEASKGLRDYVFRGESLG